MGNPRRQYLIESFEDDAGSNGFFVDMHDGELIDKIDRTLPTGRSGMFVMAHGTTTSSSSGQADKK